MGAGCTRHAVAWASSPAVKRRAALSPPSPEADRKAADSRPAPHFGGGGAWASSPPPRATPVATNAFWDQGAKATEEQDEAAFTVVQKKAEAAAAPVLKDDDQREEAEKDDIPPFFAEILEDLESHRLSLGGLKHFKQRPHIERKVKRQELADCHSDYEYIYLTVLGLAKLHLKSEEIVSKNNGMAFDRNPGVQMLERVTGLTMHAERGGSDHVLRQAPASLVEAYQLARLEPKGTFKFFKSAFDRTADPCLEGRMGRITEYIERRRAFLDPEARTVPPWEDVTLRILPEGASPQEIVGEHLRVFLAECTWRFAQDRGLGYQEAAEARQGGEEAAAGFERLFNAASFEAAMLARGIAVESTRLQWEFADRSGRWIAYDPDVGMKIDEAYREGLEEVRLRLGPKCWTYVIDFRRMVQRNPKTGQERLLRNVEAQNGAPVKRGKLSYEDLLAGIRFFVQLETLPPGPLGVERLPADLQLTNAVVEPGLAAWEVSGDSHRECAAEAVEAANVCECGSREATLEEEPPRSVNLPFFVVRFPAASLPTGSHGAEPPEGQL